MSVFSTFVGGWGRILIFTPSFGGSAPFDIMEKQYNRVMLGKASRFAEMCRQEGFIGVDFLPEVDLSDSLCEDWRDFNHSHIPLWLATHPDKTKVAAGLACGFLWTVCKGLQVGDVVLCPNGEGVYYVGKITGSYYYKPGEPLPHRRRVEWFDVTIARKDMSLQLLRSVGSCGTCCDLAPYQDEIERLINTPLTPTITPSTPDIEDASAFALEKHLEDFLVKNWKHLPLGKEYDIYEVDGELVGQQFQSDTGPMDILAVSKDRKTLLVIELKRGRTSDVVLGQIQRYMGYVKDELLDEGQSVRGLIIGLEADTRLRRALSVCPDIEFRRYKIDFKLVED